MDVCVFASIILPYICGVDSVVPRGFIQGLQWQTQKIQPTQPQMIFLEAQRLLAFTLLQHHHYTVHCFTPKTDCTWRPRETKQPSTIYIPRFTGFNFKGFNPFKQEITSTPPSVQWQIEACKLGPLKTAIQVKILNLGIAEGEFLNSVCTDIMIWMEWTVNGWG